MTSFLAKIRALNEERVAKAKRETPESALRASPLFARTPRDPLPAFRQPGWNVIAEVKFASPSEGEIRTGAGPEEAARIAAGYLASGAAMLSILTEPLFFKGDLPFLATVRAAQPDALLLRKDFMVDPYQIQEARAAGADAILLILAMMEPSETRDLYAAAKDLGLAALIEVHDEREMEEALALGSPFIGVNNRNLKTLKTDLSTGLRLAAMKPHGAAFICESGLKDPSDLRAAQDASYDGFLMGTHFMKRPDPGAELKDLLSCA
jgi:indole-3-glycerol phosphate synthase